MTLEELLGEELLRQQPVPTQLEMRWCGRAKVLDDEWGQTKPVGDQTKYHLRE